MFLLKVDFPWASSSMSFSCHPDTIIYESECACHPMKKVLSEIIRRWVSFAAIFAFMAVLLGSAVNAKIATSIPYIIGLYSTFLHPISYPGVVLGGGGEPT